MKTIPAGQFKAKCLALLDEVARTHEQLVVTKHGKPVACLIPYLKPEHELSNPLKGSVIFEADIVSPIDEEWEAEA
jgi:prevent-host-death family protein